MAKNSDRPAAVAVSWLAMGARSVARVRPVSSAAAWWSRSSGVPSPSGAIAMTDRVRPRVASSRATRAPSEYPATWNWATPNRSSSLSMASARAAAVGVTPGGSAGERPEAGKVERDDLVVVAQCLTDGLPADSGLSDPVQQDQWLARSGSMMGEIVGSGRSQAGRDECLLVVGGRLLSTETRSTPTASRTIPQMGLWVAGHSSVETMRDQLERAMAAAGTVGDPSGREVRSISDRSSQCASLERCRAGPSCGRRVGFRSEGLGRVSAATLQMSGRFSGLSVGPGPRPTRAEVATQPVRPVPPLHSVLAVRSRIQVRRCRPAGERARWHGACPP